MDRPENAPAGVIPLAMSRGLITWISGQDYARALEVGPWRPHVLAHTTYAVSDVHKINPDTGRKYRGTISLHRLITGDPPGLTVDHKDRRGLHNWRENLEAMPHGVNLANRETSKGATGFWGVSTAPHDRYRARLTIYGGDGVTKRVFLGLFDTAEEAARARDRAVIARYGLYVPLNFPADQYGCELPVTAQPAEIPF